LLRNKKYIAAAMMVANYAILRGLGNLGLSTSNTQQLLMNIASQLVVLVIINGLFALLSGWRPPKIRFSGGPNNFFSRRRTRSLLGTDGTNKPLAQMGLLD
jgi:hypothetical protein